MQTHLPLLAKTRHGLARAGVEGVEGGAYGVENALVVPVLPIGHAPVDVELRFLVKEWVETPQQLAGAGFQGEGLEAGGGGVQHAIHHDGMALDLQPSVAGVVAGVIGPGHLQLLHVLGVDLGEGGVAVAGLVAAVHRPLLTHHLFGGGGLVVGGVGAAGQ